MLPFFTEQFGNPSSMHSFGNQVGLAIKEARCRTCRHCSVPNTIRRSCSTSCGTESDSTAILSALKAQPERNQIITTVVEHPAILTLCDTLEKDGVVVHRLGVDKKGRLDLDEYKSLLSPRTAIVSAMWANNETGTLFPVETMAEMAHSVGAMFHSDAVQAVGKVAIDLKKTQIDMLSLSGHKLHAPKGRRCALCAAQHALSPAAARRTSGTHWPARGNRTPRRLPDSASLRNWPSSIWPLKTARSNACAIGSKRESCRRCRVRP